MVFFLDELNNRFTQVSSSSSENSKDFTIIEILV